MAEAPSITLDWLSGPDIARLAMSDEEILAAVEGGLEAQGNGAAVIEPRVHLTADPAFHGHFNVLRGYVAPLAVAGARSSPRDLIPGSIPLALPQGEGLAEWMAGSSPAMTDPGDIAMLHTSLSVVSSSGQARR